MAIIVDHSRQYNNYLHAYNFFLLSFKPSCFLKRHIHQMSYFFVYPTKQLISNDFKVLILLVYLYGIEFE